jgi:preprotein translocase subunit SecG
MYLFLVALHVMLCVFLVLVILLQPGKGGDVGAAFGGGMAGGVFGPRGPTNLLSRATTIVAVLFMVTSISLAVYSNPRYMSETDVGGATKRVRELMDKKKAEGVAPEAPPDGTQPPPEAPAPEGDPVDAPGDGE